MKPRACLTYDLVVTALHPALAPLHCTRCRSDSVNAQGELELSGCEELTARPDPLGGGDLLVCTQSAASYSRGRTASQTWVGRRAAEANGGGGAAGVEW